MDLTVIVRADTPPAKIAALSHAAENALTDLRISGKVLIDRPPPDRVAVAEIDSDYVLFVDDSVTDPGQRIRELWAARSAGDVLISSRYCEDRGTRPKELRREAERYVDRWLARLLTLDSTDVRSTFQMLRRDAVIDLAARGTNFDVPVDVCVEAAVAGWQLHEVRKRFWPLYTEFPRTPHRPTLAATYAYWARRNGIDSADYDMRAFNSRLAPQRAWQRRRHAATYELARTYAGSRILNVGAGSGRLALDLPGSISLDNVHAKVRYMRRYGVNPGVTASVPNLPFADHTFDCVLCCEVIEHLPHDPPPVAELVRVLKPGGRLVLSTPDYGTSIWPTIEKLYAVVQPNGYADEHITHYTERSLVEEVQRYGLDCTALTRVYRAILVAAFE